MNVVIENATAPAQLAEVSELRRRVFAEEWGLRVELAEPFEDGKAWHFIARHDTTGRAAAVLTVLDTTGDTRLQQQCRLRVPDGARVARYAQLAVAKDSRGFGIPLRLMLEARERVILPVRFDFTWLLYDAKRIQRCSFRYALGFQVQPGTISTPRGACCLLMRSETAYVSHGMAA